MAAAPHPPPVMSDADAFAALTAEVVGEHRGYALRIAARYSRGLNWLADDFESDALHELVLLARKHIENPYREFPRVVSVAIGQRLAARLERERRRHPDGWRRRHPVARVNDGADPVALLADPRGTIAAEDREQHEADLARAFELLDAIPEHWAELLLRVFADGTPLTDIARERGVHLTAVAGAVKRALRRVRLLGRIASPAGERIDWHIGGCRPVTRERVSAARQNAERLKRAARTEEEP